MNPRPGATLIYTNNLGDTLEMGPESLYRYGDCGLFDSAWAYDLDNNGASGYRREPRESVMTIYVDAPSEEVGLAARSRLETVLDADPSARTPGTMRCGEWYTRCICVARRKDNWWFDGCVMEAELTILQTDAKWIRETSQSFIPGQSSTAYEFLDYPHGYDFDYSPNPADRRLVSPAKAPCDWRITIFGPATDPFVVIGTNKYQVFASVPVGGLLVVDSRDWAIFVRDINGAEVDLLDCRIRGASGSGEYMWQPILPGASTVSWDETFGWDIMLYEEA